MQLILLFETTMNNKSDYKYVRSYILNVGLNRKFKLSPLYLNGKGNFNKCEKNIRSLIKDYQGESKVIMFIDVDSTSINFDQVRLNRDIMNYCHKNDYDLVWFKRTIEEVFWGERINQSNKNNKADEFLRTNRIKKIDLNTLNKKSYE